MLSGYKVFSCSMSYSFSFHSTLHPNEHKQQQLVPHSASWPGSTERPAPLPIPRAAARVWPFAFSSVMRKMLFGGVLWNSDFSNYFFPGIDLWKIPSGFQLVIATYKKDSYVYNYFTTIENNFLWERYFFSNAVSCLLSHTLDQPPPPLTFHLQLILCPSALSFSFRGWELIASILQNKVGTEYI